MCEPENCSLSKNRNCIILGKGICCKQQWSWQYPGGSEWIGKKLFQVNCCCGAGWCCQGQISDLKQALNPSSAQLQSMLLDPAVNLLFTQMKHEMDTCRSQLEQSQKDLAAWKFTPDRYCCLLVLVCDFELMFFCEQLNIIWIYALLVCLAVWIWHSTKRLLYFSWWMVEMPLQSFNNDWSALHGNETWPVRKENVVALQRAELRMVGWMCGVKLKDRFPSKELRETRYRWHSIGITAEQAAMVWACAAKRKMVIGWRNAWSMKWRVRDQEEDQRGPGERLSKRTVKRVNWTKRMLWIVVNGWTWVGECFFWYRPTRVVPDQGPLNGCVCV